MVMETIDKDFYNRVVENSKAANELHENYKKELIERLFPLELERLKTDILSISKFPNEFSYKATVCRVSYTEGLVTNEIASLVTNEFKNMGFKVSEISSGYCGYKNTFTVTWN